MSNQAGSVRENSLGQFANMPTKGEWNSSDELPTSYAFTTVTARATPPRYGALRQHVHDVAAAAAIGFPLFVLSGEPKADDSRKRLVMMAALLLQYLVTQVADQPLFMWSDFIVAYNAHREKHGHAALQEIHLTWEDTVLLIAAVVMRLKIAPRSGGLANRLAEYIKSFAQNPVQTHTKMAKKNPFAGLVVDAPDTVKRDASAERIAEMLRTRTASMAKEMRDDEDDPSDEEPSPEATELYAQARKEKEQERTFFQKLTLRGPSKQKARTQQEEEEDEVNSNVQLNTTKQQPPRSTAREDSTVNTLQILQKVLARMDELETTVSDQSRVIQSFMQGAPIGGGDGGDAVGDSIPMVPTSTKWNGPTFLQVFDDNSEDCIHYMAAKAAHGLAPILNAATSIGERVLHKVMLCAIYIDYVTPQMLERALHTIAHTHGNLPTDPGSKERGFSEIPQTIKSCVDMYSVTKQLHVAKKGKAGRIDWRDWCTGCWTMLLSSIKNVLSFILKQVMYKNGRANHAENAVRKFDKEFTSGMEFARKIFVTTESQLKTWSFSPYKIYHDTLHEYDTNSQSWGSRQSGTHQPRQTGKSKGEDNADSTATDATAADGSPTAGQPASTTRVPRRR